jgi:hypothetical protein
MPRWLKIVLLVPLAPIWLAYAIVTMLVFGYCLVIPCLVYALATGDDEPLMRWMDFTMNAVVLGRV